MSKVEQIGNKIIIDGKEIPACPGIKNNNVSSVVIDGHVYVNNYEWTGNEWKKTFKAWFNCNF